MAVTLTAVKSLLALIMGSFLIVCVTTIGVSMSHASLHGNCTLEMSLNKEIKVHQCPASVLAIHLSSHLEPSAPPSGQPKMDGVLDKLSSLRASSSSLFVSMGSIPCNVKIPVLEVRRMDTQYGPSVCVTLQLEDDVVKVFLPKRFAVLNEQDIQNMRAMNELTMEKTSGDERSPVITFSCSD
ncbi:hypothetical protein HPB47_004106 [Ixodes persulcatus]|uniref:Uncharacterized protein n=1 Tax=Ixodes persulcatus TaxID=34615 RepID=A0AC60PGU0_IXOPE|nr:hypothetical protein HPB47_004106 [Ixodes persulcatus]